MKVSLNWIKDYTEFPSDMHEYTEGMTMSGTKVEGWEALGENITDIVAGRVCSTAPHPDSDHLSVCQIDVGGERLLQIVTGASNVKEGDMVPVCLNGAHLPDGKVIKTGKLRGVVSEGMLCSIGELGLTLNDFPYAVEDGIFIMQEECKPGDDIRDVLKMRDTMVDFELTFNRPDCLAYLGIARETAATFNTPFNYKEPVITPKNDGDKVSNYVSVKIENKTLCPRYTARAVKNVKVGTSPLWMRARLRACGIRPISNIVDITNYVMLEYGQPMHAFDADFITSKTIVVRNARDNEKIVTLDGTERDLDSSMLCIADGEKAIALAGIMGGENSEITNDTTTVIFESANFNRENIRFTSRTVGLRTDSSRRFEKGLPAYNTLPAVNRACELVELLGCGDVVDEIIDIGGENVTPTRVKFDPKRINEILGTDITAEEMTTILKKVELTVDGDEVIVPPYRTDIINTADLSEEVVRLYGLDKINATEFKGTATQGSITENQKLLRKIDDICVSLGFSEIYSYSFISPSLFDKVRLAPNDAKRDAIKLKNPLGDETSIMRTTPLPSLLNCMATNYSRHILKAKLFENATVFCKNGDMSSERKVLVFGFYGNEDFFDLKGYTEALLDTLGVKDYEFNKEANDPSYHPGRCASVSANGRILGVIGQIHPKVAAEFGIDTCVYAAEFEVNALADTKIKELRYSPIPIYPAIERDLALVMNEEIEAGQVISGIKKFAGKALVDVKVFDVYRGKGVEESKKSIAFRLTYRLPDRTLSDDEVEQSVSKILNRLKEEIGIALRS